MRGLEAHLHSEEVAEQAHEEFQESPYFSRAFEAWAADTMTTGEHPRTESTFTRSATYADVFEAWWTFRHGWDRGET